MAGDDFDDSSAPPCEKGIPDQYGHVDPKYCNGYYPFYPSFEANLALAVLFGLSLLAHFVQAISYKKTFCWVVIMAASWETIAFSLRTAGAHDQQSLLYIIMGQIFFLLAPLWINAFAYMTVTRLVHYLHPEQKFWGLRAIRMTVLFVWLDVVSFLIQLGGAALLSNQDTSEEANRVKDIGKKVYMAGIGIQLAFVIVFSSLTIAFYTMLRKAKAELAASGDQAEITRYRRGRWLTLVLITVFALIIVRVCFRLAEFSGPVDLSNPILTNEAYVLVLDAAPMLIALVLLNIIHPGFVLKGPNSEFPKMTRAEKKALKQEKKAAKAAEKADKKARKQGYYEMGGVTSGEDAV